MGVRLTRMSTSAVVLFALVALSLTPAADATCSGTKRNGNTFCAAATCTEAECCEYAPNTCDKYNSQTVGTNVYNCQAGAQYNSANAGSVLALGTTVAQFQTACCFTTAGTCSVHACGANYATNTAVATTAGTTDAACCTENPKCSAYTCPAGYTATTANANNYIGAGITTTTVTGASTTACCTMTTGTCLAYASQVNPYSCPAGYTFANAGSTVAAICASTFLSTCCTAKTTCASYTCPTSKRVASTRCAVAGGVNTCADAECCATAYNTCANPATAALACSAGTQVTTTTGGNTAPCTQAEYQTACCSTYPTCSTYTCPGGYTANAAVATTACLLGTCGTTQCCTQIAGACAFHTCGVGKTANAAAASTVAATDAACCTDLPLCSAFTCTAGITTGKNGATYGATDAACCTADTTKCYGSPLTCPRQPQGDYYSIAGNAAATNAALSAVGQDTFNTNCCVMTELCTAYWYATGTSSSAVALRPALVTVVIGAIAGLLM